MDISELKKIFGINDSFDFNQKDNKKDKDTFKENLKRLMDLCKPKNS